MLPQMSDDSLADVARPNPDASGLVGADVVEPGDRMRLDAAQPPLGRNVDGRGVTRPEEFGRKLFQSPRRLGFAVTALNANAFG
jgi:hypothetical protein